MNLTEQVVLITGGSRGLGRAFAQALVAAGARVAITARGASELHEIAAQLSSAAGQVIAIPADVVGYWGATGQKSSIRKMSSDFVESVERVPQRSQFAAAYGCWK